MAFWVLIYVMRNSASIVKRSHCLLNSAPDLEAAGDAAAPAAAAAAAAAPAAAAPAAAAAAAPAAAAAAEPGSVLVSCKFKAIQNVLIWFCGTWTRRPIFISGVKNAPRLKVQFSSCRHDSGLGKKGND